MKINNYNNKIEQENFDIKNDFYLMMKITLISWMRNF